MDLGGNDGLSRSRFERDETGGQKSSRYKTGGQKSSRYKRDLLTYVAGDGYWKR